MIKATLTEQAKVVGATLTEQTEVVGATLTEQGQPQPQPQGQGQAKGRAQAEVVGVRVPREVDRATRAIPSARHLQVAVRPGKLPRHRVSRGRSPYHSALQ